MYFLHEFYGKKHDLLSIKWPAISIRAKAGDSLRKGLVVLMSSMKNLEILLERLYAFEVKRSGCNSKSPCRVSTHMRHITL